MNANDKFEYFYSLNSLLFGQFDTTKKFFKKKLLDKSLAILLNIRTLHNFLGTDYLENALLSLTRFQRWRLV